ncbi:bifunctional adenosylcobinamide kinase/adenosylcobinamide-phosphate guanylyltransferase [Clostridium bovifaecis]|uniref:Adenosylcobinamide kinase n=1 Tax=Clostridium bovifaecis TaxID=2184719 RepID=A0A6I6EZI9_9CLOT|nr:bifunctional adenosylcobinamide kinase/adenosylcobinamide-phosphate guanylyltransferase [Clostridium bovifaecis]
MGKAILVTGGSRSGKSKYAEELLKDKNSVLYIATAIDLDDEMRDRINKHKERRNKNWGTFEGYKGLDKVIENCKEEYILLDCVTIMITNFLVEKERDFDAISKDEIERLQRNIEEEFNALIESAKKKDKTLVMVTNEVGLGLVPEYRLGRIFRDIAGIVNQKLAVLSEEVYLVTCGIPLKIKG